MVDQPLGRTRRAAYPDYDASRHSPCGFEIENKWDDFWNVVRDLRRRAGLPPLPTAAASTAAAAAAWTRARRRQWRISSPHEAYYRLSLLWTRGGCTVHNISTPLLLERGQLPGGQADYPWCGGEMEKVPPPLATAAAAAAAAAAAPPRRRPPTRRPAAPSGAPPPHADEMHMSTDAATGRKTLTLAHDTDCDYQVRRPSARSLRRSLRAPLAHAHPLLRLPALPPRLRRRVLVRHRPEGVPPALPAGAFMLHQESAAASRTSLWTTRSPTTPPPPAPCATAETSYEAVLLNAMAQYANHTTRRAAAPSDVGGPAPRRPPLAVHPPRRRAVHVSAVSRSPVPIGEDPSYHEPFGDYFTDDTAGSGGAISRCSRDGRQHRAAVRVAPQVTPQPVPRRGRPARPRGDVRLRDGHRRGHAGGDAAERLFYARVANRLRISRHRAITAWFIGNELNGAWNAYVCEKDYEEKFLHFPGGCTFKDNATRLCELIDDACAVVQAEGKLCTTPWAGVGTPGKYNWQIGPQFGWDQDWGWQNWMKVCEGTRGPSGGRSWEKFNGGEEYEGVEHIDFWSANLYPGKDTASVATSRCTRWRATCRYLSEYSVTRTSRDSNRRWCPALPLSPTPSQVQHQR